MVVLDEMGGLIFELFDFGKASGDAADHFGDLGVVRVLEEEFCGADVGGDLCGVAEEDCLLDFF